MMFKCQLCSSTFVFLKKANRHMAKIHPDHLCPDEGSLGPSVPRRKQIVNKKRSRSPSSDGDGQVSVDFPSTSELCLRRFRSFA